MRLTVVAILGLPVPQRVVSFPIANDPEVTALAPHGYTFTDQDKSALEAALLLRESRPGTEIRLLAVAPSIDVDHGSIKDASRLCGNNARLLVVDEGDWHDCLRMAHVILYELKKDGWDISIIGERVKEGTLPHVAHHLSALQQLPCFSAARSLQWSTSESKTSIVLQNDQTPELTSVPCVISVQAGSYKLRFSTLKQIRASRRPQIDVVMKTKEYPAELSSCRISPCRVTHPCLGSLGERYKWQPIWPKEMAESYVPLVAGESLFRQIRDLNLELDQRLTKAVEAAGNWASHVRAEMAWEPPEGYEGLYDYNIDPVGATLSYPSFDPAKGVGEIRDNDIITYLLGQEPSILSKLTSAISAAPSRIGFEEWMVSNSKVLASLVPSKDHELEVAADTTARVFSRAVYLARQQHKNTIGWQDYLCAAIEVGTSLHEDLQNRPLFIDSIIEMLTPWGMLRKWRQTFSQIPAAPQLLKEIRSAIPQFEGDFQYVMVLENDKIELRICSHVDDFLERREKHLYVPHRGLLLHADDNYWDFSADTLNELNELIGNPKAAELEFQRFFEQHPNFFRKFDVREVYPLVHLTTTKGQDLVPDFLLTNRAVQKAMIVELKLPTAKLVVHRDNRNRFAQAVMEARAQLLTYRKWFEESEHRDRLNRVIGMPIYQPRLAVIIGRTSDFYDGFQRQSLSFDTPDVEVVTYDDMIAFAEGYRTRVQTTWLKKS
jgi:electron transfer flavoprotein alpha/beta subunit